MNIAVVIILQTLNFLTLIGRLKISLVKDTSNNLLNPTNIQANND